MPPQRATTLLLMTIVAAADGSSLGNPGPAGWAWVIDDQNWAADGWPSGTNNKGELTAVLNLLQQTAHVTEPLHILCDSQYVINSITKWMPSWKRKGWKKADGKPVQNQELMQQLDTAMQGRKVTFEWVRGHAGHDMNERADDLARAAATAYSRKQAPVTGPGFTLIPAPVGTSAAAPTSSQSISAEESGMLFDLPEATDTDVAGLVRSLLRGASAMRLRQLIAPKALLIDAAGAVYDRKQAIAASGKTLFAGALGQVENRDLTVRELADGTTSVVVEVPGQVISMVWQQLSAGQEPVLVSYHEATVR